MKPKLRSYKIIKENFEVNDYVIYNIGREQRTLMAKFRMGILPINIELGRFRQIPLEDRHCYKCTNVIEDEVHFLIQCQVYQNLRAPLFAIACNVNSSFVDMNDFEKFKFLLNVIWKESAKFILEAWRERQNFVYCK